MVRDGVGGDAAGAGGLYDVLSSSSRRRALLENWRRHGGACLKTVFAVNIRGD